MIEAPDEYRALIRDMPLDERPRERLRHHGPEMLSNAELIAILLRTGMNGENVVAVASRLISTFEGIGGLGRATFGELAGQKAMGEAKACQLLAAIELGKRVLQAQPEQAPRVVRAAQDVYAMLFAEMALLEQEHLKVVLLTTRCEVMVVRDVYKGNVSAAIVRVAEVFSPAIREGSPMVIAVHNHPSGDPSPSAEDAMLTKQLYEAGQLLGIELMDHVIIGRNGYVSMKEKRLGFPPPPKAKT